MTIEQNEKHDIIKYIRGNGVVDFRFGQKSHGIEHLVVCFHAGAMGIQMMPALYHIEEWFWLALNGYSGQALADARELIWFLNTEYHFNADHDLSRSEHLGINSIYILAASTFFILLID